MSALICDRCGKEILPGDAVEIVGPDPAEQRIMVDGDALVVHATCPEGEA